MQGLFVLEDIFPVYRSLFQESNVNTKRAVQLPAPSLNGQDRLGTVRGQVYLERVGIEGQ